ncbi:MAG: hypothetical protein ACTS6P_01930 [Candidatus Hodgkinia cicadicola]
MRLSLRATLVLPQMKKFNPFGINFGPNAITSRSLVGRMFAPARLLQAVQNAVEPLSMTKIAGAFIANDLSEREVNHFACVLGRSDRLASQAKSQNLTLPKLSQLPNFTSAVKQRPPTKF